MNILKNIITDFYNCCNLPVLAVDTDFNEIARVGYKPALEQILNKNEVFKHIHFDSKDLLNLTLSYNNDINYLVIYISRFNKYRGYFIIGPFSYQKSNNNNIAFKPPSCIEYLPYIMLNIADSRFSKGMSNLRFNIHVKKAIQYIHENYTQSIRLDNLCNHLAVNKSYFCKVFKKETGFTFTNFLNNYRVEKSKHLLANTSLSLLDVAVAVGFNIQNYYSTIFKRFVHKTPSEYRKSICM